MRTPRRWRRAIGAGVAGYVVIRSTAVLGRAAVCALDRLPHATADDRGTAPVHAVALADAEMAAVVTDRRDATEAGSIPGAAGPLLADAEPRPTRALSWGWLSFLFLVGAVGLLTMTGANALSRLGRPHAEPIFWAGFLLVILPVAARLASRGATRLERGLLVAGVGLMLYMSKVLHDPFAFVYSDELVHFRNAEAIVQAGGLFPRNSILPVTSYYPGLETLTAGLSQLTGLSVFVAGIVVVGAARLIIMLSLFLLFEKVSGSSRVAGLAALVYVANPNFLFWSGQYSYQSLALPLAVLAVLAVTMNDRRLAPSQRFGWVIIAMLAIDAVVLTHHLTAYALVLLMVTVSLASLVGFGRGYEAAWGFAFFAVAAALIWLVQVAPLTGNYLSAIFEATWSGIDETLRGTSETRQLFTSSGGQAAPRWERLIGLGSVVLIAFALPFGLWQAWRRRGRSALLVVLALAAASYLAILPLRLVPSAWETANRASDFLYIGIAVTVALAAPRLWRPRRHRWVPTLVVCAFLSITTIGGAVAGWPPSVRLSQPYAATVNGHEIRPQGVALAKWSLTTFGPNHLFVTDESNGRLLLAQGLQLPLVGREWRARTVLLPSYPAADVPYTVASAKVSFAVVDRRSVAGDNLAGYFFAPAGVPREGLGGYVPKVQINRLDLPTTDRLFDSGDIVVYDVRRIKS